jgi:WD40 repeat protein
LRICYSRDGKFLITGGDDKSIRIWDVADGTLLDSLFWHDSRIVGLAVSPDGRLFASCSQNNFVQLGDLRGEKVKGTLRAAKAAVFHSVVFQADGTRIFGGEEDVIQSWTMASGQLLRGEPARGHIGGVGILAASNDGRLLVSTGWDGTVRLWEIADTLTLKETIRLAPLSGLVYGSSLASDGRHIATLNFNGTIYVLRLASRPTEH